MAGCGDYPQLPRLQQGGYKQSGIHAASGQPPTRGPRAAALATERAHQLPGLSLELASEAGLEEGGRPGTLT